MKVLVIQHENSTTAGSLVTWLKTRQIEMSLASFSPQCVYFNENPDQFEFEFLIILGGGMNVDQEMDFPWLVLEKKVIKKAILEDKKILGICLGAQLLAELLGGRVFQAKQWELGWYQVDFVNSNEKRKFLHWHGQQFIAPIQSKILASSKGCSHQAFSIGNKILAFQFHPEADEEWIISNAQNASWPDIGPFVQNRDEIIQGMHNRPQMQSWFFKTLDDFFLSD